MTVVSPSQSNAGDTIEASDINNPINQLAAVINGGIDATNITDNSISTAKIADSSVSATKLGSGAITLGYAQITSNFAINSTTYTDVTSLSVTATVPTGGRRVKITGFTSNISSNNGVGFGVYLGIFEGSTQLSEAVFGTPVNNVGQALTALASFVPTPGSHTYKICIRQDGSGTTTLTAGTTKPAFILVEAI